MQYRSIRENLKGGGNFKSTEIKIVLELIKEYELDYLLENINSTAVLVECGFITNPDEAEKLSDKEYQKEEDKGTQKEIERIISNIKKEDYNQGRM